MKNETIRRLAFVIWQGKQRLGISSTPERNWKEAEEKLNLLKKGKPNGK